MNAGLPLHERIIVITGASRGLGRAIALQAALKGAHVIAVARTQGALEALDDAISETPGGCTLLPLDLREGDKIDRLGPSIYHRFGRCDALIHAAGELGPLTPVHQLKPKDLERLISVMALSAQRLIISLDPLLRAAPQGRAIFLDDALAQGPSAFWSGYQAAKAAMAAIVESYRLETAQTRIEVQRHIPQASRTVLRRQAFPGEADDAQPPPEEAASQLIADLIQGWATEPLQSPPASA